MSPKQSTPVRSPRLRQLRTTSIAMALAGIPVLGEEVTETQRRPTADSTPVTAKAKPAPRRKSNTKPQPGSVIEVVAVATPILQESRLDPLASQVTVVTVEQIADLQAQDLPSALRNTPGVVISRHNPVGSFGGGEGGAVFLRGTGVSRPGAEIQMLLDGVPKSVGIWTHPLMDVLSVDVMERIEVFKGAQPVFFGQSSFGAIAITTKAMTEAGRFTSLELAGGSYRTGVEVLQHGAKQGAFDYYLIQSFRRSDGPREASGGELQNYFGRFGVALSDQWKVSLVLNGSDNWAEDPGPVDGSLPRQGRFKTGDLLAVATLAHQHDGAAGHIKLYRDAGHIRWGGQFNQATATSNVETNTDYDNFGIRAKETFHPWAKGEASLGLDLDYIGGKVENLVPPAAPSHFSKTTFRILAPYLALNHTFGDHQGWYVIPSAGLRSLTHSEFGHALGYQAGLVVGYQATEIHASYAHGLNYPGVYVKAQDELFMPGDNRWRSLKPETINHRELGLSQRLGALAKVVVTLFRDEGRDRIVVAPPPPFPPIFTNLGTWRTEGVEWLVTATPTPNLAISAGGTYLEASPRDLPYTPRKTGTVGANYRFLERFKVSMDLLYVDQQFVTSRARTRNTVSTDKVGAYALLNAKFTWDVIQNSTCLGQVFLSLDNLTNRAYEQKKGYPMPRTNGLIGIKLQL